jgi:LytR cell envelope-related transcriptional attenuator
VHLPLAFSIHHFVSSVGADAGFAAIVGLAILVLLYFAQARETSSLRDQSVSASERVAELERRLAQLGSANVTAARQPDVAEQPAVAEAMPAAPAGVGAPALASATHLIPLPSPPSPAPAPAVARPVPAAVPAAAATLAPPPLSVTPPPATVAASAGGAAPAAPPAPVPATGPAASNGTGEHTIARPATVGGGQPRPVRKIRPGGGYSPPPPPLRPGARRPASRRWLPIVVGVVLAGIAVAALLIVTSSGGNSNAPAAGNTTNAPAPRTKAALKPSSVTVAVLNGTDVSQLAHRVALKLQRTGYREGTVATASDQTHVTTLVGYLAGHRHAASEVARSLGLSSSSVVPADQSAQAVACPPPSACHADVIVTVGSDLSNTP